MLAVGAAVLLTGYTFLFWGNKIRTGSRISLADVVIPGHYQTGPLPAVAATTPSTGGYDYGFGPGTGPVVRQP